ncbi:MAG: hydroxymethylbilane synthase [Planctomycetota bacterium]|nr:hydroxymethylbilane synthase [Planctomycetota bacterium]
MHIRIGTRHSALALWQANYIAQELTKAGNQVELVKITTTGDTTTTPLGQGGGVGLFTKEIQNALLDQRCDVAVHSLKDLPTQPIEGLRLAAVPPREDPRDCLVSEHYRSVEELPKGCLVGTGSPRRRAQLLHLRPDLDLQEIRGNVDTRLNKLAQGQYGAIVLASAGLARLGLAHSLATRLGFETMLPAVGQGALGLETRADDHETAKAIRVLNDAHAEACVRAEREVLRILRAGCLAPVAAYASIDDATMSLRAKVFSVDGSVMVSAWVRHSFDPQTDQPQTDQPQTDQPQTAKTQIGENTDHTPEALARYVTEKLVEQGADRLIESRV